MITHAIFLFLVLISFVFPATTQAEIAETEDKTVFINTPTLCHVVNHVEGEKVFLQAEPECEKPAMKGKLAVKVDGSINKIDIYVDGKLWKSQPVVSLNVTSDIAKGRHEQAKATAENLQLPQHAVEDERAKEKAQEMVNFYRSNEYQAKIQAETERLKKTIFASEFEQPIAKKLEEYYSDHAVPGRLPHNERLYVFISSSMPMNVLRNYAADADKIKDPNIVFVMMGFVGGAKYMNPTKGFVADMLRKKPDCMENCESFGLSMQIDPALFLRYGVSEVPTFVYVPNIQTMDFDKSEGEPENAKVGSFTVIKGDYPLEFILGKIQEGTGSKSIESLITALKKGFY